MKSYEDKIAELTKENSLLKIEIQNLKLRERERENTREKVKSESDSMIGDNLNAVLKLKQLQTLAESWERIVDELAHSINTDVYVAVSAMSKFLDNPKIKKANYHTRQIRDITNLLLLYLKRDDIIYSNEYAEIDLLDVVSQQIETIKDGISTLRLSSDEHEESVQRMDIPVSGTGNCTILIMKELSDAIPLILKDLVRNAMKHTTEGDPKVEIKINEVETVIEMEIYNNGAIAEKLADWFNRNSLEDPENMSKSSKVGLRVVKKWVDLLKIETRYLRNEKNDSTTVKLKFPRRIMYEKN